MFFEKCLHPVQVKIIEWEKPYLAVVAEGRCIKNRSFKFREIRINPGEDQGRIIWLKHAVVSRLSPYFDQIFGNIKTLCHKWYKRMGSCENVRIVFGKNLPKIDTRHLFKVRIEQCDLFQRYAVPEIDDQSVFAEAARIGRESGRSKPHTGIQNISDPGCAFSLDKVLAAVFGGELRAKLRIIDDKSRCDFRQIIFYIFKKITGVVVIMPVIR